MINSKKPISDNRQKALYLILLAVPVGIIAGAVGIFLRILIDYFTVLFYGVDQMSFATAVAGHPFWKEVLILMLAGLFIGLWTKYLMPKGRIHNPADIIESSMLGNGRMSLKAGFGVFVISIISISAGSSAGRFGPAMVVGATVASKVAGWLKLNQQMSRTMLAGGVAGVISASFNVPIAGVFFALEIILGSYRINQVAPVVVASIAGHWVNQYFYGGEFAFVLPEYSIAPISHLPLFVLLGVLSALTAIIYMELTNRVQRVHNFFKVPNYLRPVVCGFILAVIAIQMPYVLGSGEQGNTEVLYGQLTITTMLLFFVLKIIATSVCFGSGFGGGIFAPAITFGLLLGSFFGIAVGEFGLGENLQGYYALAGISAVCAVILGATISTIIIVFEMTGDYQLALGVMVATIVASTLTKRYYGYSFFTKILAERGVELNKQK